MPKGMKRAEDAQRNNMGQGSPRCRNGNELGLGWVFPYSDPIRLLNGFFFLGPRPAPVRFNRLVQLGQILGPNHGPITINFFKAQMPKIGLTSLKYEEEKKKKSYTKSACVRS